MANAVVIAGGWATYTLIHLAISPGLIIAGAAAFTAAALSVSMLFENAVRPHITAVMDKWLSVTTVQSSKGTVDTAPKNDEEWKKVRQGAIALTEASNLLMMPGRHVAAPGDHPDRTGPSGSRRHLHHADGRRHQHARTPGPLHAAAGESPRRGVRSLLRAARAGRWLVVPLKNDARLAEHQPVGTFRRRLTGEILPVPFHGLDRVRGCEMQVVDHVCKTSLCGDWRHTSRGDECRSSHYPKNYCHMSSKNWNQPTL